MRDEGVAVSIEYLSKDLFMPSHSTH
jgi:hypothetical protein